MTNKFKYCPHCGHKVSINAKFCPHCGHKIPNVNAVNKNHEENTDDTANPSRVSKNNDYDSNESNNFNPVREWFSKRSNQIATGVVAILLLCGIGVGVHHNHETHQQQQTSQQQSNQNNNQNQSGQNNQPKPKPLTNYQRTKQVEGNFLNAMEGYTSPNGGKVQAPEKSDPNKLHTFINTHDLAQFYLHGSNNSSFKQMLNWCENQSKAKTPVQAVCNNFHLHHINGDNFMETYRVYYAFNHQPAPQQAGNGVKVHTKYQAVEWHTLVKKLWINGGYHWFIVKSSSSKNVTTPSNKALKKVGLNSEQMVPNA